MSSKRSTYIKDENRKYLIGYLLFHFVLFAVFSDLCALAFTDLTGLISKLKNPSGFLPLVSFPLAIILNGIIYSDHKAIVVFWRFRHPLPGNRAFSVIAPADPRVDMGRLNQLFPEGLPEKPKDQNTSWYNLYKKYRNTTIVYNAHRAFLLTRDLATLTAVLIPFCVVAHLIWGTTTIKIVYHLAFLFGLFFLICVSAQNYGRRLVANVLVEAIA